MTTVMHGTPPGCEECVRALYEGGASLDQLNKFGESALHKAAFGGKLGCCKLLIEWGANASIRRADGKTALEIAQFGDWRRTNAGVVAYLGGVGC